MIWGILYFICTVICCGIILYVNDIDINDAEIVLATMGGLIWPILLVLSVIYMLGYCINLLLQKIIKTK